MTRLGARPAERSGRPNPPREGTGRTRRDRHDGPSPPPSRHGTRRPADMVGNLGRQSACRAAPERAICMGRWVWPRRMRVRFCEKGSASSPGGPGCHDYHGPARPAAPARGCPPWKRRVSRHPCTRRRACTGWSRTRRGSGVISRGFLRDLAGEEISLLISSASWRMLATPGLVQALSVVRG